MNIGSNNGPAIFEYYYNPNNPWATKVIAPQGATIPAPAITSPVAGYAQNGARVFYIAESGCVYYLLGLVSGGSGLWSPQILFCGAEIAPHSMAAYDNNGPHVFYLDVSNHHVRESYPGGSGNTDLTSVTASVPAAPGSAVTGYRTSDGSYAYYVGADQHVHQLYWGVSAGRWVNNDLTSLSGGALPVSGTALTSFNGQWGHHIYFIGSNQHVYELTYGGGRWNCNDLSAITGKVAQLNSELASFGSSNGNHVFFFTEETTRHLVEVWWNSSPRTYQLNTILSPAHLGLVNLPDSMGLAAFTLSSSSEHVFSSETSSGSGKVYELHWASSTGWAPPSYHGQGGIPAKPMAAFPCDSTSTCGF